MPDIRSSVACNLDHDLLLAVLPLLESERVQAIEWSFDTLYAQPHTPDWFVDLLKAFGREGRLIGHGVFFSLFSGCWTAGQQDWLKRLRTLSAHYRFDHVTEHFGFMTGEDFHKGAPISIPFSQSTLSIGSDRLKRIQDACTCPVGLENLAFAYSTDEVKQHGDFLNQLVEPVNGFIILDLHNLYCQSHNFGLDGDNLLAFYPLNRVREIHISGGSWSPAVTSPDRLIRRDTHDDAVPTAVFDLLEQAIDKCPNLRYVVLEQLGSGLETKEQRRLFGDDFLRMDQIVVAKNRSRAQIPDNSFRPTQSLTFSAHPVEDPLLYAQQITLSTILETAVDYQEAQTLLAASNLAHSDWEIERWEPVMLETAISIAQKWKNGFV